MTLPTIKIYDRAIEDSISATFYSSDGMLEIGAYDGVLASVELTPDATDEQIQDALKEVLGLTGKRVWEITYDRSDLAPVPPSDIPIVEVSP